MTHHAHPVLILFAHPALQKSRVNCRLRKAVVEAARHGRRPTVPGGSDPTSASCSPAATASYGSPSPRNLEASSQSGSG